MCRAFLCSCLSPPTPRFCPRPPCVLLTQEQTEVSATSQALPSLTKEGDTEKPPGPGGTTVRMADPRTPGGKVRSAGRVGSNPQEPTAPPRETSAGPQACLSKKQGYKTGLLHDLHPRGPARYRCMRWHRLQIAASFTTGFHLKASRPRDSRAETLRPAEQKSKITAPPRCAAADFAFFAREIAVAVSPSPKWASIPRQAHAGSQGGSKGQSSQA